MVFFHVFPRLPHYLRKPKSMKHPEDSRSDNLRTSAGKKVLLQSHLFGSHPAMVSTTLCQPRAKCRVRGPETVALILCTDDIWWQGCVCHEDQPSGSKCFWLRVWALHGARSKQYILAISCNILQSRAILAEWRQVNQVWKENRKVVQFLTMFISLSLSLSIIIILKILIVIRFKSTKSKKTAVLNQRPLMVSQTVSASTQVALAEIGVSNALALPWVGRQRQTKLQYGTCSSHLIVKLSMPYAFACWSSYPMSK